MALVLSLQVTQMLLEYLGSFELAPVFTEEEVLHYLMPVDGVIETHVVEGKGGSCRHCFHACFLPAAAHCNYVCKPTTCGLAGIAAHARLVHWKCCSVCCCC